MIQRPIVSIIIPTYNRKHFLETALSSIHEQTYNDVEIVIIDDGSTDGTREYLQQCVECNQIIILGSQKGSGPGINRRSAFDEISGEYVIFFDDDDYYTDKNFLSKAVSILENDRELSVVMFNSHILSDDGHKEMIPFNRVGKLDANEVLSSFMIDYTKPMSTFTSVFSVKKLMENCITEMVTLNDTQIYLRSLLQGKAQYVNEDVGAYRVHDGSIGKVLSLDFILQNVNEKILLKKHLPYSISESNWLYQQIYITLQYYIQNSSKIDWIKLVKWLLYSNIGMKKGEIILKLIMVRLNRLRVLVR